MRTDFERAQLVELKDRIIGRVVSPSDWFKEQYVGKTFKLRDVKENTLYLVSSVKSIGYEEKVSIEWEEKGVVFTTEYSLARVIKFIEDKTWEIQ